jgi:hypothetical protein
VQRTGGRRLNSTHSKVQTSEGIMYCGETLALADGDSEANPASVETMTVVSAYMITKSR